ncbi:MAG TPA: hypothetical protein VGJ28_04215 [Micromonosporaceae bacterium]|jgi:formate hydrogenlyase subunit 3/multisubunit Na+/H+ antiporter MnhD subunit
MNRNTVGQARPTIAAIYAGLALTIGATLAPYVDRATLTHHLRAGYPSYSQAHIDSAATIYLVYLSIVGVLGIVSWLWTAHAVRVRKRWVRPAATVMFAIAVTIALTDLLIKDTSGSTGLPPLIGWAGVIPCLPGLLALALLWRARLEEE